MAKSRAREGHWKGRKAVRNKAPLFLGVVRQTSQAGKELHQLLPDKGAGSRRNTSAARQPESQKPEELAISDRTRTDAGRHKKGLVSLTWAWARGKQVGCRGRLHSQGSRTTQPTGGIPALLLTSTSTYNLASLGNLATETLFLCL